MEKSQKLWKRWRIELSLNKRIFNKLVYNTPSGLNSDCYAHTVSDSMLILYVPLAPDIWQDLSSFKYMNGCQNNEWVSFRSLRSFREENLCCVLNLVLLFTSWKLSGKLKNFRFHIFKFSYNVRVGNDSLI